MFITYEEERNYRFYEDWMDFWLPIYRKQVLNAKLEENEKVLKEIKINIMKNKSLDEYKNFIFEKLGINYLKINLKSDEQLKEEQFLRNERLIYLALKKKGLLQEREELYDVGLIGLMNGINTYDSSKGYKESTYFYRCIANQINQYIYLQNLPKRRCPTSIISLDKDYSNGDKECTLSDIIPDPSINIEEEIIDKEKKEKLLEAIEKLKPDYQEIIKKRYGIGTCSKSQKEIGKELGVSRNAIDDKRKRALKQLRIMLEKENV